MVKGMLVALGVVVVVSCQLPSSLHPKCLMQLHMQLHQRPNPINPANFIYMRPCFIKKHICFFKFCLSSKWDPLQAATKFFGAPFCSVQMWNQQQQQHHQHCCVLEAILNNAASKSKSSSKGTYSPCSNRASPGSTASCASQERKNRHFLDFANGLDFCCGCQYLNGIQLIQATYSRHPTSFLMFQQKMKLF